MSLFWSKKREKDAVLIRASGRQGERVMPPAWLTWKVLPFIIYLHYLFSQRCWDYHHILATHCSVIWQVFVLWKYIHILKKKHLGKQWYFTYKTVLFCMKFNWNDLNDLCKVKYWVFLFLSLLALVSHRHINDYLSKSHCLLTRYEGFLDTIMTAFYSLDNI